MAHFEVKTSAQPGRTVVALTGECDLATREELTSVLLKAVEDTPEVLVDLAGLTFLDSSGVHALVVAVRESRARDGRLFAVNAAGVVAHVLELTGMAALLRPPAADGRAEA